MKQPKHIDIDELSKMAKKVTDLYVKMNSAWPNIEEQNLKVAIMAGLQDAYIKGQKTETKRTDLKQFLESKMKSCDELGGMEKEKWAFIQCLKMLTSEEMDS
ncbi:MAG: hypothetical protein HQ506_01170 [Candidatus Marinimicrobia bacterium]|nr:hypothetical protein [Candidatus Neomarinimicrobiota bacterium]